MKKLFLLLTIAVLTACNTEDEKPTSISAVYTGKLTVTSNASPDAKPYESENNIRFEIAEAADGTFNLTMHDIRFAEAMPRPLTIVLPSLRYGDVAGDGFEQIYSTVDPIVPYIGGKPFDSFKILEFRGAYPESGTRLDISFTCKNPQIPVGDEPLDHKAFFSGTLAD